MAYRKNDQNISPPTDMNMGYPGMQENQSDLIEGTLSRMVERHIVKKNALGRAAELDSAHFLPDFSSEEPGMFLTAMILAWTRGTGRTQDHLSAAFESVLALGSDNAPPPRGAGKPRDSSWVHRVGGRLGWNRYYATKLIMAMCRNWKGEGQALNLELKINNQLVDLSVEDIAEAVAEVLFAPRFGLPLPVYRPDGRGLVETDTDMEAAEPQIFTLREAGVNIAALCRKWNAPEFPNSLMVVPTFIDNSKDIFRSDPVSHSLGAARSLVHLLCERSSSESNDMGQNSNAVAWIVAGNSEDYVNSTADSNDLRDKTTKSPIKDEKQRKPWWGTEQHVKALNTAGYVARTITLLRAWTGGIPDEFSPFDRPAKLKYGTLAPWAKLQERLVVCVCNPNIIKKFEQVVQPSSNDQNIVEASELEQEQQVDKFFKYNSAGYLFFRTGPRDRKNTFYKFSYPETQATRRWRGFHPFADIADKNSEAAELASAIGRDIDRMLSMPSSIETLISHVFINTGHPDNDQKSDKTERTRPYHRSAMMIYRGSAFLRAHLELPVFSDLEIADGSF